MRTGWKYKRLEDACSIDYGTRVVQKKDKGSKYYVYGGGGATFMVDEYNREDCLIVSRFAMSAKCTRFVKGRFFLNDSGLSVSTKEKGLIQKFVDKALLANNDRIYSFGKGMAQRNLDMPSFRGLIIPIPPLPEQERIVAELDLLQSVIDKQKEQLKELDTLAQSIFYDMFGDPVENEKGWEIRRLGDLCLIERGGSPRPIEQYLTEDKAGINWIKIGDATEGGMIITSTKQKIISEGAKKSRFVQKGDFLLSNSMSFGKPYILGIDGCIHDGWLVIRDSHHTFNKVYLYYFLGSQQTYEAFKSMAVGGVVNNLNKDMVKKVKVAVPDISVQQSFADKIEAIERQKEAISKSIAETQKLFDYTMDKYFE